MEHRFTVYTSRQISRYVDNELPRDLYLAIDTHQQDCPDCRRLIGQYRLMAAGFSNHVKHRTAAIDRRILKDRLVAARQSKTGTASPSLIRLFNKNIYLKLASIVAILVISLAVFREPPAGPDPEGPSAIVKSVDTDVTSVMIIETEKQQHTIIWFSET